METKLLDQELLKTLPLPDWNESTHKGDRGKLLLLAGSASVPGAAILAALAALRSGCGSVRLATGASIALQIGIAVPELLVVPLPENKDGSLHEDGLEVLRAHYDRCDALVLGPGLVGQGASDKFLAAVLEAAPLPAVVDAAALDAAPAALPLKYGRVLTPNLAEFAALQPAAASGETSGEDEVAARLQGAQDLAERTGSTVVSKGNPTLIATPDQAAYRNEAGNRCLGTAGSGDVLAGIIGGLLAQGVSPGTAAAWGVHLHALAGEALAKDLGEDGILARDLIERLPGLQKFLRKAVAPRPGAGFGLRHN